MKKGGWMEGERNEKRVRFKERGERREKERSLRSGLSFLIIFPSSSSSSLLRLVIIVYIQNVWLILSPFLLLTAVFLPLVHYLDGGGICGVEEKDQKRSKKMEVKTVCNIPFIVVSILHNFFLSYNWYSFFEWKKDFYIDRHSLWHDSSYSFESWSSSPFRDGILF